MKYSLQNNTV